MLTCSQVQKHRFKLLLCRMDLALIVCRTRACVESWRHVAFSWSQSATMTEVQTTLQK